MLRSQVPRVSSRFRWLAGLAGILLIVFAGSAYWKASHALRESASAVAAEASHAFTFNSLVAQAPSGVEPIRTPPAFHDMAIFGGATYLSGATGLYVYDQAGELQRSYRVGLELPPAELGAMTLVRLPGKQQGELFIATAGEGLLAFDGVRFRQLLPERMGLRKVTALLPLSTGRLLWGTENDGVAVFDGQSITMFSESLRGQHITALAGSESDVWAGTLRDGLWHSHAGQMEHFRETLADPQILALAIEGNGVYAGTPLGVAEFRDGQIARTVAGGVFARALLPRKSTLLVGSEDEGVVDTDLRTRPSRREASFPDTGITEPIERLVSVGETSWALTGSAVYRNEGSRWTRAIGAEKSVLADRNVSALHVSAGGNLWVGFFDRGLDIVGGDGNSARHLEDERLFCVNRIAAPATDQGTAVATANGLVLFDGADQVRQVLGRKDGLLADHVTDVVFRGSGMVAATPAGLSFVDGSGVRSLYVFQGLVNNHVYAVAALGDEVLAGTLGGLSVLDHEVVRANYTTANSGLKHNWITALVRVGDDWFAGTYGAGVLRWGKDGQWDTFPDVRDRYVVNPHAMLVAHGRVLAGSLDRGLWVYNTGMRRWTNFTTGLPSRNVTALAEGTDGVYVGTDNGVVRVAWELLP